MMKHKVKYRVVGTDRSKRKYSINLEDGASFQLSRELLQGAPAQEGSEPLCALMVQSGVLWVRAGADQEDIVLNGKPHRESEARPGDLVQVSEFSIEILECPHTVRNETNATQFLDVSEMFSAAAESKASSVPAKTADPLPAPTESQTVSQHNIQSNIKTDSNAAASALSSEEAPPAVDHAQESTRWSSKRWDENQKSSEVSSPMKFQRDAEPVARKPQGGSAHGSHGSVRDTERFSSPRHPARAEKHDSERYSSRKPIRREPEPRNNVNLDSDVAHIALSAAMAAMGVAGASRILVGSSSASPGTVIACAACASVPVVLGASFGLSRLNAYLSTDSSLRDYARFLGWAVICSVPWTYTLAASFPVAIFTTLLTTVLISVAFIGRFRPDIGRFSAVGGGLSVVALAALITHHHVAGVKAPELATEAPAAASDPAAVAAVTPGAASNVVAGNTQALAPAAGAVPPAQAAPLAPAAPNGLAPVVAQTAPTIPSAVNDTIPAIPAHAENPAAAAPNRLPAATDPSAKGIIDPLAHEEFFSAIKMGNLEVVRSLVDRKSVDPDFTLDKGSTPLIVASASGRIKVVEYLVRRRVNINAQDPHGTTALMWAVFKGHREIAKYLIKKGADTKVIRDDGQAALDIARKWKQTEIVALLKKAESNGDEDVSPKRKSRSKKHRR